MHELRHRGVRRTLARGEGDGTASREGTGELFRQRGEAPAVTPLPPCNSAVGRGREVSASGSEEGWASLGVETSGATGGREPLALLSPRNYNEEPGQRGQGPGAESNHLEGRLIFAFCFNSPLYKAEIIKVLVHRVAEEL